MFTYFQKFWVCLFWYHCKLHGMLTSSRPLKTHFDYYSFLNRRSHIQTEVHVMQSICNVDYIRKAWHWSIKKPAESTVRLQTFNISHFNLAEQITLKHTAIPQTHQGKLHCGWRGGWWSLHRGRAQLPPFYIFYDRRDVFLHVKAKIPDCMKEKLI